MSYKTWIGNKICLLWTNWVLSCKFMNEILYVIYLTHICVLKSFAKLVNSTTSLRCNLRIWTTVVILHWQFWRRMNALVLCAQTAKFILFEGLIQVLLVWCLDLPTSSFSRLMLMKMKLESRFERFVVVLKTQNWEILPDRNLRLILHYLKQW